MGNELTIIETQLKPLAPHFEQALAGVMPVDRLIRTALISVERNPFLIECDRQSFFNSIMSAAVLGLEIDGVTGQAFPIPFKRKVQLVIGYKGYQTLGARAGLTIDGQVVREGDDFDYLLGSGAFVRHKPKLGNKGQIIGAWAMASANGRPPIIAVLGIDEILDIRGKSPGAQKKESPWNDHDIGFPAMASKTAKRRLCRSLPLNVMQLAARMEEAFEEQGKAGFLTPDRNLIVDGEIVSPIAERTPNETPTAEALMEPRKINDGLDYLREQGTIAAKEGMRSLEIWFKDLKRPEQKSIKSFLDESLKPIAAKADAAPAQGQMDLNTEDVAAAVAAKTRALENAETEDDVKAISESVTTYLRLHNRQDLLADFLSAVKARSKRLAPKQPAEVSEF